MDKLKFGIPKGSLEKATIDLFQKAGWVIKVSTRNYFPTTDDPQLSCAIIRAQEMSRYVEEGVLDAAITGKDWIVENNSEVVEVQELIYSKESPRPARWVLVVTEDSPIKKPEDLEGKKVATELVAFTRRYFSEKGIRVKVEFSWGTTEAKVVEGLVDAIVDVTETGSTIRAHGLRIVQELMQSTPRLIASKEAWADPWKKEKILQISTLLKAALGADRMVGLKMNIPEKHLQEIITILPCLNAPTVASLYQSDWYSVEVVVREEVVRELIPLLLKKGAEGIIEYALNKVI
ncbi:MAG: phosphoribosyltransferase [Deltaproteobacteria bacterium]|nr:phosphoribosyltransferase [Deltaproteobacteria bacterium]MBP1717590.1 phosphoribosyltransferase [Deltaproteobacteria bacterium]